MYIRQIFSSENLKRRRKHVRAQIARFDSAHPHTYFAEFSGENGKRRGASY